MIYFISYFPAKWANFWHNFSAAARHSGPGCARSAVPDPAGMTRAWMRSGILAAVVALMAVSVFFMYLTANTYWAIILDTVEPGRVGSVGGFWRTSDGVRDPQFKAGYFRLYPYGKADRQSYNRLDGADVKIS